MAFVSGTRLGERYEILAQIGVGGIGEVYRAKDLKLNREVAIKVLRKQRADEHALHRFELEARALAALSHTNILAIHDFATDQGVSFVVMELLEGETLRSRIANSGLPWRKAVEIGITIAEGLAAAHSKGIIHRDLKPENIFLTSSGQVKILDFGLAQLKPGIEESDQSSVPTITRETEPGVILGTPNYMSPEQVRGATLDARSDLFSFGCVLYEMITGQRAFTGQSTPETMSAILKETPPNVSDTGKQIPPELEQTINHCLEKNPEERFQSTRDLVFDLRQIAGGSKRSQLPAFLFSRGVLSAILLFILVLAALALYHFREPPKPISNSLAVLPFTNVSADPDTEYLSDGITESLINSLSQLHGIRVIARSSAFRYKDANVDPLKAGRDLKVGTVLTGRVLHHENVLVVQVDLMDVGTGLQLWGDQYTSKLADIFQIQEQISKEISEKLRIRLTQQEEQRLTRRQTENVEAYQLYLKGRYYWNRRTPEALMKGVDYFTQAIALDPAYALAYVGLADCYNGLAQWTEPEVYFPKSQAAVTKALKIDPTLAEAHTSLAFTKVFYDWDWKGAEAEFKRAIELDPNYPTAHQWYGLFLGLTGRFDLSTIELKQALKLDPLSPVINWALAEPLYCARNYEAALEQEKKALEIDPNFLFAHMQLANIYHKKGMYEESFLERQKSIALLGDEKLAHDMGEAYKKSGYYGALRKVVEAWKSEDKTYVNPWDFAVIYMALGEKDQAMDSLEKAYEKRSTSVISLQFDPWFDDLRSDPRFEDLLKRIGLPQRVN